MTSRPTISVVTTTFNEADNIAACLQSVAWCDERIVVDGTSTDGTIDIARQHTPNVYVQPNHDQWNINKNYGFDHATGDWLLSLDADERITPALAEEIRATIASAPESVLGFEIARRSFFFGREVRSCGMFHTAFRLFRHGAARFDGVHLHEPLLPRVPGEIRELREPMLHYTYDSIAEFVRKTNVYTDREGEAYLSEGYRPKAVDLAIQPLRELWKRYIRQKGYTEGTLGLTVSGLYAMYTFLGYAKAWERATAVQPRQCPSDHQYG